MNILSHALAAVAALAVWLITYLRISAPVNRTLTAAAASGHAPPDARSLQRRWDGVITTPPYCRRQPSPRCASHSPSRD